MKKQVYIIFRKKLFIYLLLVITSPIIDFAQDDQFVWIKIEKGHVLYLSTSTSEWIPCNTKEKILSKNYILTKDSTIASIYKETENYDLPSNSYFFVSDILERDRFEIISALTQIEAEQLPETKDTASNKVIGLIYGQPPQTSETKMKIPYEQERNNAISWFINNDYYSAALLSLKRIVSRYPHAYLKKTYIEQLFFLYDWFNLHGFLREEAEKLLSVTSDSDYENTIKKWYNVAREKL